MRIKTWSKAVQDGLPFSAQMATILPTGAWGGPVRNALRMAMLGAGISAAVAVVLTASVIVGVSDGVRVSHVGAGSVATLSDRMALVLAERVDWILRLARCPIIENGL